MARCQNGKLCRFGVLVGDAPEERRKPSEQLRKIDEKYVYNYFIGLMQDMEVVDNASDENNENTRRKATVVPIKIEYV